ncbi:DUF3667 domain-containing protein [Sphingosinicella sp. CPCC 101087]|uniref:DUF3667 domain-containing protein n=1 Tax=Sphingosinicella sp. CPCC 101087 TaxID=2497754 RepID=UPI00101B63BD|nr:DUF3667 domain-containing protein [Sphingosinicella sp. CPCC 101087]
MKSISSPSEAQRATTTEAVREIPRPLPDGGRAAHRSNCLNCRAAVQTRYCGECGQKVHVHRSVGAIGHDLVHGVLHLDGKLWRTLPLLVWRPGELTRRYVEGERAKFVSPLGMFLFAVFLMFATLSIYGLSLASLDLSASPAGQGLETARVEVVRQLDEARARRAALERGEAVRNADGSVATAAALDREIEQAQERVAPLQGLAFDGSGDRLVDADLTTTGWARLDKGLSKLNENPGLALYKIQANGYKFSWLLIPLSVPFVWVLFFWTRRFRFYDHSVFVTYSLAFMTLFGVLLTIAGFAGVGVPILGTAGTLVPAIHMYRQLKQAYGLGWFGALVRTFLLLNFCLVTASLFFVLLLGIGALG